MKAVITKFAEQAIQVDRVLKKWKITSNPGHLLLVLQMANTAPGVSQKEIVDLMALPKDVVCKLVSSMVGAKLLKQKQDTANPRVKRLRIIDCGRQVLSEVNAVLRRSSPKIQDRVPKKEPEQEQVGLFETTECDELPASNRGVSKRPSARSSDADGHPVPSAAASSKGTVAV